jgi:hypothetical protein
VNREELVAVASRLFAVYLAITGIYLVATSIALNHEESGTVPTALVFFAAIVPMVAAVALWLFPLTIARKLLPAMKDSQSGQPIGSSNALKIGLTLMGVWLLAQSVPDVIYWTILWSQTRTVGDPNLSLMATDVARMASAGARLLIGMLLVVGSARLNHILLKLRFGSMADEF